VSQNCSALFRGRHFEDVIIILCVRWYLRYSLSHLHLEEMMGERGLSVDHVTVWRWVQHYAPILNQWLRRELRRPNRSRGWTKRMSGSPASEHTSIGQLIHPATRSISCCRPSET
jgi:hypothetical protein